MQFEYGPTLMADVVYSHDKEKFKAELETQVEIATNYALEVFKATIADKSAPPDATEALPAFFQCISRYKHRGFAEENEVRIAVLPAAHNKKLMDLAAHEKITLKQEKLRKFRESKGECIPYIELFGFSDITLPIEKIIVGPHRLKDSRASMLKAMLAKSGIGIEVSDIPYTG